MVVKVILVLFMYFLVLTPVNAQSDYVLPYPSFMPGNIFYKVSLVKDKILKYWYFGDFGQFKYNLKQADKYLVEAKILFEYKQYWLAVGALEKSDAHIEEVLPSLLEAERNEKNISEKSSILKLAKEKHIEVLEKIKGQIPETFYWDPEKGEAKNLKLHEIIDDSIKERLE